MKLKENTREETYAREEALRVCIHNQVFIQFSSTKKNCAEVKIYKKEKSLRGRKDELSIHHFVIDAELREVQVWENAFDLLEC